MNSQHPSRGGARRELLALQKRLWRRLQREIDAAVDENPPNVDIYKEEYARDLRSYEAVATKRELVEAAAAARVVYVGDYHSLAQSQRTLVKLLLAVTKLRPDVVLCMEMVHMGHQPVLDDYMRDAIDSETFLKKIDYHNNWDFPWPPYREIFAVAKKRGVKVVAINSDPKEHEHDHLLERDFRTAIVVAGELEENPDGLVIVFDGDLHVARDHLPFIVENYMQHERGIDPPPRQLIIHQNAEDIYWRLAKERKEREINVVRLTADSYCVINASPIEKLQSYLNWVHERDALMPPDQSSWDFVEEDWDDDDDEAEEWDDPGDRSVEYAEQVFGLICSVAGFLEIEQDDLDGFTVYTVNDLDFLGNLVEDGSFTEAELEGIKMQIVANESYFIPKADIIYLADFSLENAAEEATHFLHHRCSGYTWRGQRSLNVDFYFRVVTEAIGFLGSKLIVPTRECWQEADCEAYVAAWREKERHRSQVRRAQERGEPPPPGPGDTAQLKVISAERVNLQLSQKLTLEASKLVLEHRALEREWLETGYWAGAGKILTQSAEVHLLVTTWLGHMIGDKLHWGLLTDAVDRAEVRALFFENLEEEGVALARYLALVKLTAPFEHGGSRSERL